MSVRASRAVAVFAASIAAASATQHGCSCMPTSMDHNTGTYFEGCGWPTHGWCDVAPGCAGAHDASSPDDELRYDGWDECLPGEVVPPSPTELDARAAAERAEQQAQALADLQEAQAKAAEEKAAAARAAEEHAKAAEAKAAEEKAAAAARAAEQQEQAVAAARAAEEHARAAGAKAAEEKAAAAARAAEEQKKAAAARVVEEQARAAEAKAAEEKAAAARAAEEHAKAAEAEAAEEKAAAAARAAEQQEQAVAAARAAEEQARAAEAKAAEEKAAAAARAAEEQKKAAAARVVEEQARAAEAKAAEEKAAAAEEQEKAAAARAVEEQAGAAENKAAEEKSAAAARAAEVKVTEEKSVAAAAMAAEEGLADVGPVQTKAIKETAAVDQPAEVRTTEEQASFSRTAEAATDTKAASVGTTTSKPSSLAAARSQDGALVAPSKQQELSSAIGSQNAELVETILDTLGPDTLLSDSFTDPPLVQAAGLGAVDVVRVLLAYQPPEHWLHLGLNGDTALLRCILADKHAVDAHDVMSTAEVLLSQLPPHTAHRYVEMPNLNGDIPLFAAIRRGRAPVLSMLLNAGANPMQRDSSGYTCLHLIAAAEDKGSALGMAQALLEYSHIDIAATVAADLLHSELPGTGTTPLMIAATTGNVELLEYLLRQPGATEHVDKADHGGRTTMHHAAMSSHHSSTSLTMMKLLIQAGGDIHAKDRQGAHPTQKAKTLPAKMRTKYGLQRFAASVAKDEL